MSKRNIGRIRIFLDTRVETGGFLGTWHVGAKCYDRLVSAFYWRGGDGKDRGWYGTHDASETVAGPFKTREEAFNSYKGGTRA